MSTKTLRKRIALVAVSALGAGLLSVVASTTANAAVISGMNIFANAASGGAYAVSTSGASQGLVSNPTSADNGTGLSQTASMYSNGVIVVATTAADTAQKISVTGGTLASTTIAGSGTPVISGDLTSVTEAANTANRIIAAFKPSAVGTPMVIKGYDDSSAAANWKITVTVVAIGSSGNFSAANSNIALVESNSATPSTANVDNTGANIAENGSCVYLYYNLKDGNNLQMPTSTTLVVKSDSGFTVGLTAAGTQALDSGTYGGAAARVNVCQATSNVASTGNVTLTVGGVDVATRKVTIVGQLAKITVSSDAIAVRNAAGTEDATYGDFTTRNVGTWYPSHSFTAYDSAGNLVPATVAIVTSSLDAQVTGLGDNGSASPRNANKYLRTGGLTFACADSSGSNAKVQVKATAADGTTITSNAFTVTCAGIAVNYKANLDKSTYNTGDVMSVTITGTDKSGAIANDYEVVSTTAKLGTIASGAIASDVLKPKDGDTLTAGSKTYKFITTQTAGDYSVVVDFPLLDSSTYSQTAITVPVSVKAAGTSVSNAEVLAAIVKLIASINKQIAALQKALMKK